MDESCLMLPHMAEVFDVLRKGRHVCSEDGGLYIALRDHREAYETLFTNLGFDFYEHPRGFFFFRGGTQLSEGAERMAVFMFVLIEDLSSQGLPVEEALMTRLFDPRELPHFHGERSRQYMKEVGVATPEDLPSVLKKMEGHGFVDVAPDGTFRFRVPICRFLELCTDFIKVAEEEIDE